MFSQEDGPEALGAMDGVAGAIPFGHPEVGND